MGQLLADRVNIGNLAESCECNVSGEEGLQVLFLGGEGGAFGGLEDVGQTISQLGEGTKQEAHAMDAPKGYRDALAGDHGVKVGRACETEAKIRLGGSGGFAARSAMIEDQGAGFNAWDIETDRDVAVLDDFPCNGVVLDERNAGSQNGVQIDGSHSTGIHLSSYHGGTGLRSGSSC